MKTRHRILTVLLTALMTVLLPASLIFGSCGSEPPFTGAALTYYNELTQKGFPADYAEALTRLHLLYPAWEFEPLPVARSWRDTVALETKDAKTNLIHNSDRFSKYRHKTNATLYDSGFYQASQEAVSYFLDPRNFLTEADIFQFYDQRTSAVTSREALNAVISGTFMENGRLENGQTYASALMRIGEEVGIDPVFLAVRLRQEQGDGKSPLLGGKCGSLLKEYYTKQTATTESGKPIKPPAAGTLDEDLTALDGYYNLFNIGASGDGVFSIYKNALIYAEKQGWDTKEKALRGGAEFLKNDYIKRGQTTVYLQKFDVCTADSLHQYMQNVGGALSEGRSLYRFFAENALTDIGCVFRIPVFSGMPARVSQDPANGACEQYATAASLYTYTATLTAPLLKTATQDALFGDVRVMHNETLTVSGAVTGNYLATAYEYAWDGGDWNPLPVSDGFRLTVPSGSLPAWGDHLLTVRAQFAYNKAGRQVATHTLCAALNVTVVPPPSVTLTLRSGNAEQIKMRYEGDVYTFPTCADPDFIGYAGSDGTLYPSGYTLTLTHSVTYTAVFLPFSFENGASVFIGNPYGTGTRLRFSSTVPVSALNTLPPEAATLKATLLRDGVGTDYPIARAYNSGDSDETLRFVTPNLSTATELRDSFSVSLTLSLHYSDGTERTLTAASSQRTAVRVAIAALADESAAYSAEVLSFLKKLIS